MVSGQRENASIVPQSPIPPAGGFLCRLNRTMIVGGQQQKCQLLDKFNTFL
jgi:hypothetical protein